MELFRERVAFSLSRSGRPQGFSRLRSSGRTAFQSRVPIRFLSIQDAPGRFCQVPRHRADRLRMTFVQTQPAIEAADVTVGKS
jgi:hypothetical protein